MIAFDLLGLAVFQLMMTRLGVVEAAATQIVMMLTSLAYMPAVGLGMAGTTLVGQSIGAGDARLGAAPGQPGHPDGGRCTWAASGLLLALAGPWLATAFVSAADPERGGRGVADGDAACGSRRVTSSSTGCSSGRASACGAPATRAFLPSCCSC